MQLRDAPLALFDGPVQVLLDPALAELAPLLRGVAVQLGRELGARLLPIGLRESGPEASRPEASRPEASRPGPGAADSAAGGTWQIGLGGAVPRLVVDRSRRALRTEAPTRAGLFETFAWLREVRWLADGVHPVRDCASLDEALDRVEQAVARSWPSHALRGIDWPGLCALWRPRVRAAQDPIPALMRWLSALGDSHTGLRPPGPPGRLPYRARVEPGPPWRLVLSEVPPGTAGDAAGARPGDVLIDLPPARAPEELWARSGATPQMRPWSAGLRGLRGPVGQVTRLRTERGPAWQERYAPLPWPEPLAVACGADGVGRIRLRQWAPALEAPLHRAIDELADCRRLELDLRGNGGGNLAMAERVRGRFLERAETVGSIQYSAPGGGLGPRDPVIGRPHGGHVAQPLTVRVDGESYSSSEDFLMGLAGRPGVHIEGGPTGGGSGRMRWLRLLPGWRLTVSTALTFLPDGRCIERDGIGPARGAQR